MTDPGGPVSVAEPPATPPPARPASQAGRPEAERPVLRAAGLALLLLAVFALGFAWYLFGLSGLQEHRDQSVMFTQLRNELANEVAPLNQPGSTPAPVNAVTPGQPLAVLDIPAIGIRDMVVVDGTTADDLTHGPGLLPSSVLPGQPGVSAIYGRRATFGAPFGHFGELRPGEEVTLYTGEGKSVYRIKAFGSSVTLLSDSYQDRLVLVTAYSPQVPTYYITVDAHLISKPFAASGTAPVLSAPEYPLAGDDTQLWLTAGWSLLLAGMAAGATVAAARWSAWATYLVAVPLILAVAWNLFNSLAAALPNIY